MNFRLRAQTVLLLALLCSLSGLAVQANDRLSGNYVYLPYIRVEGTWKEPWDSNTTKRWTLPSCATVVNNGLHMECESAAAYSIDQFDASQPIQVTATVTGASSKKSSSNWFWAGLVFLVEDDPNSHYVELSIERNMFYKDNAIEFVHLSFPNKVGVCCTTIKTPSIKALEGVPYTFSIRYKPGEVTYLINNVLVKRVRVNLDGNPKVGVLCVAEEPGTSKPGSLAECRFGAVTVLGNLLH